MCVVKGSLVAIAFTFSAAAHAQTAYEPPRTHDGRPDFTGVWIAAFVTPMQRPPFTSTLVLPPDQVEAFSSRMVNGLPDLIDPDVHVANVTAVLNVRGEYRSSLILDPADGQIPYTETARRVISEEDRKFEASFDHPEERGLDERCLTAFATPPMRMPPAEIPLRIVQTGDHVVLSLEDVDGARIAPIGKTSSLLPAYNGRAVARYEGDTLVVDSTNFRVDNAYRVIFGGALLVGPDTQVVERFTRLSDDELLYEFAVADPLYYSRAWSGEFVYRRRDVMTYEYACHEANYSMRNILLGGRAEQARAAAAGK